MHGTFNSKRFYSCQMSYVHNLFFGVVLHCFQRFGTIAPIDRFYFSKYIFILAKLLCMRGLVCVCVYVCIRTRTESCCILSCALVCYLKTILHFNTCTFASNAFSLFVATPPTPPHPNHFQPSTPLPWASPSNTHFKHFSDSYTFWLLARFLSHIFFLF